MKPTYSIVNWAEIYENNRSRELVNMRWVPIPNCHDGDGYIDLVDRKNGAALFGAWIAIVQLASRCKVRGVLTRDSGEPHDSKTIARVTRISEAIIEEALEVCQKVCKWLEMSNPAGGCDNPASSCDNPAGGCVEEKGRNGTELNGKEAAASPSIVSKKPTQQEVEAYAIELGLTKNDGAFKFDGWLSNGFTANGKPVKDWKAAMRTWQRGGFFPSQKDGSPQNRRAGEYPETIMGKIITI
jgi:hypothetical protein